MSLAVNKHIFAKSTTLEIQVSAELLHLYALSFRTSLVNPCACIPLGYTFARPHLTLTTCSTRPSRYNLFVPASNAALFGLNELAECAVQAVPVARREGGFDALENRAN